MTSLGVYRNTITAPPIAPPRYSLLTAATVVDEPGLRWEGGYEFVSELGGRGGAADVEECPAWWQGGNLADAWTVTATPVVLWAEAPCTSTMGTLARDWQGIARRLLQARQSAALARWLGFNRLTPAAANEGAPAAGTAAAVVAELEDWLATALDGPLGTLHMSPGTLAGVVGAGLARLDGARYVTPIGTPVIADAGYASDEGVSVDGGDTGSIIASGPIRVRLGPIEVTDPPIIDALTNTVAVVAWRPALVELDPGRPEGPTGGGATTGVYAKGGFADFSGPSAPATR